MARFYLYDISKSCGFISKDWACPENGLYECDDFKSYFENPTSRCYLIRMEKELAGFVLLDKAGKNPKTDWNMGQFFILGKFQGKGIARQVANDIWKLYPGLWEVSVIPENVKALAFWRKAISIFTKRRYSEEIKTIDYDEDQPERYILSFDARI
jgi:predicted acetyltransferase